MKYAIYDKAADGYLTKLEFENDVPVQTLGLVCGYNEYITEAKLLDTKDEAFAVVTRIESNKFMEKGRFVIHSFDEKLADQYIISETGNPTKVVDSITVNLDGGINVKYGTMLTHWSTKFLEYAINRMNALQKAASTMYTPWCNTFDIYKVITVTDERSCTHYQFINVTSKGLEIFSSLEYNVRNIVDESVVWKNKAQKAEKALEDQKKLNETFHTTIVRYRSETQNMNKENHELRVARDCSAEIIYAIRNAIINGDTNAFDCIESRMIHDPDFSSDPFMAGVRENILDICNACKRNIANNDLKNSEIARLTNERDKALERAEKFKGIANSIYGITIPGRCNGKQGLRDMLYDLKTGMKVLVDKKKYDDLVEYVANINLTYDTIFCMMDKPVYLSTITEYLNDLTK